MIEFYIQRVFKTTLENPASKEFIINKSFRKFEIK